MQTHGMAGSGDEERARLDELRRGLYRPGATELDVQRYTALSEEAEPDRPPARAPLPARRRRPIVPVLTGLLVAALGVGAVGIAAVRQSAPTAVPTASSVPSSDTTALPDGSGWRIRVDGDARAPAAAGGPGRPTPLILYIDGVATAGQVMYGKGRAVVPIDVTTAQAGDGKLLVWLYSPGSQALGWQAYRSSRIDARPRRERLGSSAPRVRQVVPRPGAVAYRDDPPDSVVVDAPEGVPWTLTTVLTARSAKGLT